MWIQSLGWEDPWRRKWQPTPVFLSGKSHGQRSLAGYSPWGHKRVVHNLATEQQQPLLVTNSNLSEGLDCSWDKVAKCLSSPVTNNIFCVCGWVEKKKGGFGYFYDYVKIRGWVTNASNLQVFLIHMLKTLLGKSYPGFQGAFNLRGWSRYGFYFWRNSPSFSFPQCPAECQAHNTW